MPPFLARIRRKTRHWAWPWLGALFLAGSGMGFYLSVVQPASQTLVEMERLAEELQAKSERQAERLSKHDPRQQLVGFYGQFPPRIAATDELEQIHAAAQANRLELTQGEYLFVGSGKGALAQYQITLPLKGSYPDIRNFVETVLADLPSATMDKVSFDRQKIGEPTVQATMRLSLFHRDGP